MKLCCSTKGIIVLSLEILFSHQEKKEIDVFINTQGALSSNYSQCFLRTVPRFVITLTSCATWNGMRNPKVFLHGLCLCGKSRSLEELFESKEKIVTTHFSAGQLSLNLERKCHTLACILKLFWNDGCLIISEKYVVTPNFLF